MPVYKDPLFLTATTAEISIVYIHEDRPQLSCTGNLSLSTTGTTDGAERHTNLSLILCSLSNEDVSQLIKEMRAD